MAFTRTAINTTGNFTNGNASITNVANTTGLYINMMIYGPNVQADTLITGISGTTVTMNRVAVGSATGAPLTGQYIIQSGTDDDPSGLSAITGVTTITSGAGSRLKSIFDLGLNQLRIQGTLNFDPDQYTVISNLQFALRIEAGGTFNYGKETTVNGRTSYSKSCGLELTYQGGIASNFPMAMNGGNFIWRGGIIRLGGALSLSGGNFDQKGDTSVIYNNNTGTQIQLRTTLPAANMKYENIKLAGVNQVFFWTINTYGAISGNLENGGIQTTAGFSPTQIYDNFAFSNNQAPFDFYLNQLSGVNSTLSIAKNPDVVPRVGQLNVGSYGVVETRTELNFNVLKFDNSPAENVVTYIKDTDNGSRTNENQLNVYTTDQKYLSVSDNTGIASLGDVLVNVQMRDPLNVNTIKQDWRSNYGNNSVDFNVFLGGYDFNPVSTRQSLIGNGGKNVDWTVFDDVNPTLSQDDALVKLASSFNIDTVNKIITVTSNSGLEDLYDATKAYKYNGSIANFETPAPDKLLVEGNGEILTIATDWNLVIASGVSLLRGAKFRQLKLTGTGILTNDGTINFPFEDALGTRVSVNNLDPENFGVTWNLRYKKTSESVYTEISGLGNATQIIVENSVYDLQARVAGYTWKTIQFDTAESLSVDMALQFHLADDGTPQYLKPFNQSLVDIFEYDDDAMEVKVTNTTGSILEPGFPELYRVIENVQQDPSLVWLWINPVTTNATSQRVLLPPTSPLRLFLSADSDASVKITCPVVYSDTGISADDRVKGNPDGFSIILGSAATADSSLIVSQLITQLGGVGFNTSTDSLTEIKTKVNKGLTKTQFISLK